MEETTGAEQMSGGGKNKLWYIIGGVVILIILGALVSRSIGFMCMRAAGVDVDRNMDGTMTYETNEGSVTVGQGASMPDNWPSDAPAAYSGAKISYSGTTNPQTGQSGSVVMYTTTASAQSVGEYYTSRLKSEGWNIEGTANMGRTQVSSAKKDTRTIGV